MHIHLFVTVLTCKPFSCQEWGLVLSAKHDFFNAIAQYHQARVAKDKGAYGEGVARFQLAEKHMASVAKNSMGLFEYKVNFNERGIIHVDVLERALTFCLKSLVKIIRFSYCIRNIR